MRSSKKSVEGKLRGVETNPILLPKPGIGLSTPSPAIEFFANIIFFAYLSIPVFTILGEVLK